MSGCEMELCTHWTGEGCACAVFGLEPDVVGERVNPCPDCGEHVNAKILSTSPACPHGWGPVTGPADLADLYTGAWTTDE